VLYKLYYYAKVSALRSLFLLKFDKKYKVSENGTHLIHAPYRRNFHQKVKRIHTIADFDIVSCSRQLSFV